MKEHAEPSPLEGTKRHKPWGPSGWAIRLSDIALKLCRAVQR